MIKKITDSQGSLNITNQRTGSYGPGKEVGLLEYWKVLAEYKFSIIFIAVLFTMVTTVVALRTTSIYRAETLLSPVSMDRGQQGRVSSLAAQFGGLASIAGIDLGSSGNDKQIAIATLKSRSFAKEFILDQNLLPLLFKDKFKKNKKNELVRINSEIPSMWDAYKIFNRIRKVIENKKTGMIVLSIEWSDPELAASWVNKMVVFVNKQLRANAIQESERNMAFLQEQIAATSVVEIQQSMFGLIEIEMNKAMLANANDEYSFKVIDKAVVPEEKIRPKRALLVILGLMTGLFLGILYALFKSYLKSHREDQV